MLLSAQGDPTPDEVAAWQALVQVWRGEPHELRGDLLAFIEHGPQAFSLPLTVADVGVTAAVDRPRVLDPACGRGEVLVRVAELLSRTGMSLGEIAESIVGCDRNPLMVAITRSRLNAWSIVRFGDTARVDWRIENVDPLLIPRPQSQGSLFEGLAPDFLQARYDLVVTRARRVSLTPESRSRIRPNYRCARGLFSYDAPLAESLFDFAQPLGHVCVSLDADTLGREFGQILATEVLPRIELTHGFYLEADSGDDEIVLLAKNRAPIGKHYVAARLSQERRTLASELVSGHQLLGAVQPWRVPRANDSFLGGVQAESTSALFLEIESPVRRLRDVVDGEPGRSTTCGLLEVWIAEKASDTREYIRGRDLRDWMASGVESVWFPYGADGEVLDAIPEEMERALQPFERELRERRLFGRTQDERERPWFAHLEHYPKRIDRGPVVAITGSSHPHVAVLDSGALFASSVPTIPIAQTETRTMVAACLSSSLGCFWLRKRMFTSSRASAPHMEIATRRLLDFPLPDGRPHELEQLGERMTKLARSYRATWSLERTWPRLVEDRKQLLRRMVGVQEEIDWSVYRAYGLTKESPTMEPSDPGERRYLREEDDDAASVEDRWVSYLESVDYKRPWGRWDEHDDALLALGRAVRDTTERLFAEPEQRRAPFRLKAFVVQLLERPLVRSIAESLGDPETVLSDYVLTNAVEYNPQRRLTPEGFGHVLERVRNEESGRLDAESYQALACRWRGMSASAVRNLHWQNCGAFDHPSGLFWFHGDLSNLIGEPVVAARNATLEDQAAWVSASLRLVHDRAFGPPKTASSDDPRLWGLFSATWHIVSEGLHRWHTEAIAVAVRREIRAHLHGDPSEISNAYNAALTLGTLGPTLAGVSEGQIDLAQILELQHVIEEREPSDLRRLAEIMMDRGWVFEQTRVALGTLQKMGKVAISDSGEINVIA